MSLIEDLKAARAHVAAGWIQYQERNEYGVCAAGAINAVCAGWTAMPHAHLRRKALFLALAPYLPAEYIELSHYNDADSTTRQDILDLYDKALAGLGGLA